ncbi:MAG: 1-hydroxycarotenoid 3,4-desaturase CrtD [Pseudomonadota bacterium]
MNVAHPPLSQGRLRALVVGGGIAGLACALRLQAAGLQVTLLERHGHTGGKIRTVPSAAGPVDAGPTVLTMRHVFDGLFAAAGARLEDHVHLVRQDRLARHFWPDGSQLDLFPDKARSSSAIEAFAGARAADEFRDFHARTSALFNAFDAPMMQAAEPGLSRLMPLVLGQPSLMRAMAPFSSLAASLARQFSDPRLAQLFGRYATYVGGAPQLCPALLALIWQAEAAGVWIVDGGMHKLAEAITGLCTELGVHIRPGAHVQTITRDSSGVTGVALATGEHLPAGTIVFAGDPRALATGALGPQMGTVAPQTATAPRSFSARVISFAAPAEGLALDHHNILFDADPSSEFDDLAAGRIPRHPTLYICAEDRGTSRQPPDLERFEIIANAPALAPGASPDDTTDRMELASWNHQIVQKMKTFGLTFSPPPTVDMITSPHHFAQMFPASLGALYGQTPHGMTAALKRPRARTKIPGLYLCGGGTHPGAGVPMATISARHAAEAILRDQTSISPSRQMAMPGGMSMG